MSYCNINDAFNINSNFENIVRGLNTFNPTNNSIDNIKSGYDNNLNSKNSIYEDQLKNNDNYNISPNFNSMYESNNFNDNMSWESLNGTDLSSKKIENKERKLTHRECINIYNNPNSCKVNILSQALKHVTRCKICKEQIKDNLIKNPEKEFSDTIKELPNQVKSLINNNEYKNNDLVLKQFQNSNINSNINSNSNPNPNQNLNTNSNINQNINPNPNLNKSNIINENNLIQKNYIESELKLLNDKINEETNIKYQNAMIQNNIAKYLEDIEEKKKINNKLDKIIEIINYNNNQYKTSNNILFSEYQQNQNLLDNLSPKILNNLSKLSQAQSTISMETYGIYIGICLIVILIIIDIILRINTKNQ